MVQIRAEQTYKRLATGATVNAPMATATAMSSPPLPQTILPSDRITLGAAVERTGTQTHTQAVAAFSQLAGATPIIDHQFYGVSDLFPDADHPPFAGQMPMITWEPFGLTLDQINSGTKDTYLTARANACKARNGPILFRPMHEMNGNWYPWSGAQNGSNLAATTNYQNAWRRIRDLFTTAGANNVYFVWCINSDSVPSRSAQPWNDAVNYYPGSNYVDYIGVDGYNFGTGNNQLAPAAIFNSFYLEYNTYGKQVIICETSSADNVLGAAAPPGTTPWTNMNKAQWMADLSNWLDFASLVDAVAWFNYNKEQAWQIDSSPSSLAAFKTLITNWNKM